MHPMSVDSKDQRCVFTVQSAVQTDKAGPVVLKQISMTISADKKHIHIHFVTRRRSVTTVQLEATLASRFFARLGALIDEMSRPGDSSIPRWH